MRTTGAGGGGPVTWAGVTLARAAGAYDIVSLAVPPGPAWESARPGQFLVLPGDPARGEVLPTLLWVAEVSVDPVHGTAVDVVVPAGGGWATGQRVRLIGPLGRGFGLPAEPVPSLLVGQGGSVVPLRWLVAVLRSKGCEVHLVLAADDPEAHLDLSPLRRQASSVVLTTPGDLLGAVAQVLDQQPGLGVVFAAGPRAAVREVAAVSQSRGRASRVCALDLDETLLCGTGLCGQCDVPVMDPRGARTTRPCLEGPVVPGEWLVDAAR